MPSENRRATRVYRKSVGKFLKNGENTRFSPLYPSLKGNIMARITTEDCTGKIPNHFDLTLVAARRARQLENNSTPLVDDIRNNKATVTALREIAAGHIGTELLKRGK